MSLWIAHAAETLADDIPAPPDEVRDFYVDLDNIKVVHPQPLRPVGIIGRVPQTHTTNALANPAQPHHALVRELERYIEAHNPELTDVNVVSMTDTGRADTSHKPVRHWYHVTYEA